MDSKIDLALVANDDERAPISIINRATTVVTIARKQ